MKVWNISQKNLFIVLIMRLTRCLWVFSNISSVDLYKILKYIEDDTLLNKVQKNYKKEFLWTFIEE